MLSSLVIFSTVLKYLQFPSCNYFSYIGDRPALVSHTRLRLNFSALRYDLFQTYSCPSPACPLCDVLLKNQNVIFCTAQDLLLCVRSGFPLLHIYLRIDGIVLPIRQKIIGFNWYFSR